MACPICSATMQNMGLDSAGRRTFWCGSCGTLRSERDGIPAEVSVPSFVDCLTVWQNPDLESRVLADYRHRRQRAAGDRE